MNTVSLICLNCGAISREWELHSQKSILLYPDLLSTDTSAPLLQSVVHERLHITPLALVKSLKPLEKHWYIQKDATTLVQEHTVISWAGETPGVPAERRAEEAWAELGGRVVLSCADTRHPREHCGLGGQPAGCSSCQEGTQGRVLSLPLPMVAVTHSQEAPVMESTKKLPCPLCPPRPFQPQKSVRGMPRQSCSAQGLGFGSTWAECWGAQGSWRRRLTSDIVLCHPWDRCVTQPLHKKPAARKRGLKR